MEGRGYLVSDHYTAQHEDCVAQVVRSHVYQSLTSIVYSWLADMMVYPPRHCMHSIGDLFVGDLPVSITDIAGARVLGVCEIGILSCQLEQSVR
jgi:hypothetical protein